MSTTADPVARIASAIDAAASNPDAVIPVPLKPPASWFRELPESYVPPPQGPLVQIDLDTGRVAALVAPYGECILDGRSGCWTPGRSKTNYEYAHVGAIVTAEGETIRTANVGGGINHFDTSLATAASLAADHYANTATRRMVGRYVDMPDVGIVFLGSMYPGTTYMHAYEAMTSALSGDWRWIESLRDHEMVGAQLVNNPGFRPNPLRALRPIVASVRFRSTGAKVAGATECTDAATIVSEWEPVELPRRPLGEQFDRLEALTASLMDSMVDDVPLLPEGPPDPVDVMDLDDDGDEGEDWAEEFADLSSDECRFCRGVGCAKCDWMGYTGADEAVVASVRTYEAVVARAGRRRRPNAGSRPRDGDGDGFVYDGTARERPFNPLTDLVGRALSLNDIGQAASGNRRARNKVRKRAASNYDMAVEQRQTPDVDKLIEATLGPRPTDPADASRWDQSSRDVREVFDLKRRGAPTPGDDPDSRPGNRDPLDGRAPRTPTETAMRRVVEPEATTRMGLGEAVQRDLLPAARTEGDNPFTPVDGDGGELDAKIDVPTLERAPQRDLVDRDVELERKRRKRGRPRQTIGDVYLKGMKVNSGRLYLDSYTDRPGLQSAGDDDAPDSELAERLFENGGFTYDPNTGTFPTEGIAVAVPGHSMIVTRDEFMADPERYVDDYFRRMEEDGDDTLMIGGWHDKANDEIVFDRVEVVADRDEAMRLGVSRDEQAVYDLATGEELPTGGTGGRDDIDIIGREGPAGDGPPGQAGQPDDPGGATGRGQGDRSEDDGAAPSTGREGVDPFTPVDGDEQTLGSEVAAPEGLVVDGVDYSVVSPQVLALAEAKHASAMADEPAATAALQDALDGFDGGRLQGLDYRFKGVEKIAEKIRRKQVEDIKAKRKPRSDEDEAARLGDALRYTAIVPTETYGDGGIAMLSQLEDQGFQVDWANIKNLWAPGDDYSGVNVKVRTPSGILMELQFHTEESYATKDAIHPLYELSRDPAVEPLVRLEAFDQMSEAWDDVPLPQEWENFGDLIAPAVAPEGLERYRRATDLGFKYDPTSKAIVDPVRLMDASGKISDSDWGEETILPLSQLGELSMNEKWIDGDDIDRVDQPDFKFRENYPVKLYRDPNGVLHVVDGHTRIAMRQKLGQDVPVVIYDGPVEKANLDLSAMGAAARAEALLPEGQRARLAAGRAWAKRRGISLVSDAAVDPALRAQLAEAAAALPSDPSPERFDALDRMLSGGVGAQLSGKVLHNGLGPNGDGYVAARAAVHREMTAEFVEAVAAAGIPQERRALLTAGLAGSGKTFSLNPGQAAANLDVVVWDPAKGDPPPGANAVVISADYVKQRMAELGLNPGIVGLRPMEEAALMHAESGDIARLFEQQLTAAGYNVVLDGTLRDELQVRKQLDLLERNGYGRPDLVGADITIDESKASAVARYMDEAAANPEMGGRFVPSSAANAYTSKMDRLSLPRDNMDHLIAEGKIDRAVIINNEGVSNVRAESLDAVDPRFPLPSTRSESLRGDTPEEEWQTELDRRGITVADNFGRVVGRYEGTKWVEYEGTPQAQLGPGGYPPRSVERAAMMPGVDGGAGTKANPFKVTDVNTAAILLLEGEYFIELDQERKVALLVDRVSELVDDALANQRKLATYDLCRVTVPGTNLFCAENKGYPRINMPQLSTDRPTPGSFADSLPRSVWELPDGTTVQSKDVDLVPEYLKFLDREGIEYADTEVRADELKATQSELTGSKIVGNVRRRRAELQRDRDNPGRRILVTRDGYILDGHHGWAANVAISISDGRPTRQAVTVIDTDILDILDRTVRWATDMGSPSQGAAMPSTPMAAPTGGGDGAAVVAAMGRRRGVRGLPVGSTRPCYTC